MAVSNAYKFLESGLDPQSLYFRSFLRPTFVGLNLVPALLDPLPTCVITRSPSDKFRRVWHIYYDGYRHGYGWNRGIYPVISGLVLGLTLLLPLLTFGVLIGSGIRPWTALAGGALLLDWHMRAIEEILTQSHNLALVVLMTAVVMRYLRGSPGLGAAAATGAALATGFLAIHSMVVAIVPLLLWIVAHHHWSGRGLRQGLPLLAGAAGLAVPVLIWYEGYLRGLLFEIAFFDIEQWETQLLMNYTVISARVVWGHLTVILGPALWPVVLTLGLVPLALAAGTTQIGRARGMRVGIAGIMVLWVGLVAAAIRSQEYIFNRFFLYGFLPVVWLLCWVVDSGLRLVLARGRSAG
jgi:hypothetical protein